MELSHVKPTTEVLEEFGLSECEASVFKFDGFISTCAHGHGRGANDRQFYYVNSRPCEPSKVSLCMVYSSLQIIIICCSGLYIIIILLWPQKICFFYFCIVSVLLKYVHSLCFQ